MGVSEGAIYNSVAILFIDVETKLKLKLNETIHMNESWDLCLISTGYMNLSGMDMIVRHGSRK